MNDPISKPAVVSCTRASSSLAQDLEWAAEAGGGWDWLHPADVVLFKPNYNSPHPPPGSLAPDMLRAVIELLRGHGAEQIILGESTSYPNHRKVLEQTGVSTLAQELKVKVVIFDEDGWEKVAIGGKVLKHVWLTRTLRRVNRIVYVCCPKTHHAACFTGSLKLTMGFFHSWRRTLWHFNRLQEKIADLNLAVRPDLILADMRRTFIHGGPATGELREPGLLLASTDRVALDMEAIRVIRGFPGNDLPRDPLQLIQIQRAIELGLGSPTYHLIER